MDADIQLGELEEAAPEVRLRPDENKHFAVIGCFEPDERDLPIFVDVDVMRDIESHAETNTNVELGGVLLGGQYHDADGNPFVEITDSLRAEHYEATKGSFKFTHETWEAISRQRDEFPDGLQMVGWYHTHPDWGVFLSNMDMFICDNFFNRALDVALVVDPCRDDRGWFQWTGNTDERVRRTGGFYLTGSRFRADEIQYFADIFSGEANMAANVRHSAVAGRVGAPAAPIVNITDSRGAMQSYVIVGMLMMQFLLLALIAWQMSVQTSQIQATVAQPSTDAVRQDARDELLAEIVTAIAPETGEKIAAKLGEANRIAAQAKSDLEAQRIAADEYAEQRGDLTLKLKKSDTKLQKLRDLQDEKDKRLTELEADSESLAKEMAVLKDEGVRLPIWKDPGMWTTGVLLALFSAIIGFGAAIGLRKSGDHDFVEDEDDRFYRSESNSDAVSGSEDEYGEGGDAKPDEQENPGIAGVDFRGDR